MPDPTRSVLKLAIALAAVAAFFVCPRKLSAVPVAFAAVLDTRGGKSPAQIFAEWPREKRDKQFEKLTEDEKAGLRYGWKEFWARPNQLLPPGEWTTWLIDAGRGFGKTRSGAEAVRQWVKEGFKLVNIIAPTADDARDICIEGESGIMSICSDDDRPVYLPSKRRLEWRNGAITLIFTADEPERLRGKQHMKLWCDELAAWRYLAEAWDQAMLGLRLGKNPQAVVTTTPRPLKEIKELIDAPTTLLTRGTTYDNRENLAAKFYSHIITKYEGTRLGRQELNAELLEDNPNALFKRSDIEKTRMTQEEFDVAWSKLVRIVGAIDPAVTSNEDSDETGIIFAAHLRWNDVPKRLQALCKHPLDHFIVFDDRSDIYTPDAWGKAAIAGYRQFKADRLVGEVNNGGEMVESTLRHVDENVSYTALHASRGKQTRAEPISAIYEQYRVHHVGNLAKLEDQLCDYDPKTCTDSPDRLDADVWALTELSESSTVLGLSELMGNQTAVAAIDTKIAENVAAAKGQGLVTVAKKEAATGDACPECGNAVVQRMGPQERRCIQCGKQWTLGGTVKGPHFISRAEALANHGGR